MGQSRDIHDGYRDELSDEQAHHQLHGDGSRLEALERLSDGSVKTHVAQRGHPRGGLPSSELGKLTLQCDEYLLRSHGRSEPFQGCAHRDKYPRYRDVG